MEKTDQSGVSRARRYQGIIIGLKEDQEDSNGPSPGNSIDDPPQGVSSVKSAQGRRTKRQPTGKKTERKPARSGGRSTRGKQKAGVEVSGNRKPGHESRGAENPGNENPGNENPGGERPGNKPAKAAKPSSSRGRKKTGKMARKNAPAAKSQSAGSDPAETKQRKRSEAKSSDAKRSESKRGQGGRAQSKRSRTRSEAATKSSESTRQAAASAGTSSTSSAKRSSRSRSEGRGRRDSAASQHSRSAPARIAITQPAPGPDDSVPALSDQGRTMLINAAFGDECRIAVLHENRLEELFIERLTSVSHVGNIYKGIITNVEPSIQACFVDFGGPKHGFLHISDVQPQYFQGRSGSPEGVGHKVPRRERPPIQSCFRRGQEVIVQITKEGMGTKGPTLTTYLSIPGRYLVMMPGMSRLGVSRKIEDEEARRRMRVILEDLELPKDMGFILRTAGIDRTKRDLQRDLKYLERLWTTVVQRVRSTKAPSELYQESDLVIRTIRDVFSTEFDKIIVDTQQNKDKVCEFLRIALPRSSDRIVELYDARVPIFHHYGVEEQIEAIHSRHVKLPSGGSIVIDPTEALVAIDVNSGKFRSVGDEESLAYQTNLEAADEIARQLRLRDLGGLIICDFIDMRQDRHKRSVEKRLRDALKKHKERARILRISRFGLIEMTRQRQGPPIKRGVYADCPHCGGSGMVKSPESMTLHVLRIIQTIIHRDDVSGIVVTVSPEVANDIHNRKRGLLHQIETETNRSIVIRSDPVFTWDQQHYAVRDAHDRLTEVVFDNATDGKGR